MNQKRKTKEAQSQQKKGNNKNWSTIKLNKEQKDYTKINTTENTFFEKINIIENLLVRLT